MSPSKSSVLNIRIQPELKEAARNAADQEHRSIANYVETLIRKDCQDKGITIPEQRTLFKDDSDEH